MLAWSFNRDGEDKPGLIAARDKKLATDTNEKNSERQDLEKFAKPQSGVDALNGKFTGSIKQIPGVVDKNSSQVKGPN